MMIQIDMKNWWILISYFVLSAALGYLVLQIKRSVDAAKWRREQQALWSRHFLENYPNRLLTYCDGIAFVWLVLALTGVIAARAKKR